jgi:L-2-hydroxyglutarate oxidase
VTGPADGPRLDADVVVVGAGIVGLATARALQRRRPGGRVLVLDKEAGVGAHQTGHNSGVIHAGVYYPPGSAKARLCRAGRASLLRYCDERGIATEVCGKVVVATTPAERERLEALGRRAEANGLEVRRLDRRGLAAVEPHVRGLAALHVPATGIVDFGAVAAALAADVRAAGGELRLGSPVAAVADAPGGPVRVVTAAGGELRAGAAVVCAGLHSDRLARRSGARPDDDGTGAGALPRILPFRGEYHELRAGRRHLVRGLVYPVPDPRLPFLGVHLTRDIHGGVHVGPNAVPALAREGYRWGTVVARDLAEVVGAPGTWRLARRFWRTEAGEVVRSLWRARFVAAVQRLVPDVGRDDLVAAGAGVRAQAVRADGTLVDDFAFAATARTVHVINAPSPAATASLAIGEAIADRLDR